MSLRKYSILVLGVAAATFAAAWSLVSSEAARTAMAFGAALATLNALAAHAIASWSERRSTTAFLGAVFGGMLGRLALMSAAVLMGVLVLELPRLPLVVSLLGYFVVFLILELTVQHRHAGRSVQTR